MQNIPYMTFDHNVALQQLQHLKAQANELASSVYSASTSSALEEQQQPQLGPHPKQYDKTKEAKTYALANMLNGGPNVLIDEDHDTKANRERQWMIEQAVRENEQSAKLHGGSISASDEKVEKTYRLMSMLENRR
jgi:hypothetical protein